MSGQAGAITNEAVLADVLDDFGRRYRAELNHAKGYEAAAALELDAAVLYIAAEQRLGTRVNVRECARRIGVSRQTLHTRLRRLRALE